MCVSLARATAGGTSARAEDSGAWWPHGGGVGRSGGARSRAKESRKASAASFPAGMATAEGAGAADVGEFAAVWAAQARGLTVKAAGSRAEFEKQVAAHAAMLGGSALGAEVVALLDLPQCTYQAVVILYVRGILVSCRYPAG